MRNQDGSFDLAALAAIAGAAVLVLYLLGGFVLAARFWAADLPTVSSVQQVPREGLIAIAVQNVILPAGAFVAVALGLARLVERPGQLSTNASRTAIAIAVVLAVASAFLPGGGLFAFASVACVAGALALTAAMRARPAEAGLRKNAAPVLAALAVFAPIPISLSRSLDKPVKLDTVVARDEEHHSLAAGYLIAEDNQAVYVATPGPTAVGPRELVVLRREDVALLAIARRPDDESPDAAICRLAHVGPVCE